MANKLQLTREVDFAIAPFAEAIAYESLMSCYSQAELEKELPAAKKNLEPSAILKFVLQVRTGLTPAYEVLFSKISKLLETKTPFYICTPQTFHYPQKLQDAKYPLKLFYHRGDLNLLETPCISVVGSRLASRKGLKNARIISTLLIEAGFTIVSGLAKGIDTVALQAADRHPRGRIIAVIGTPIDQYYPKENKELQDKIAKEHLLISHVPFYKYSQESFNERRFYFPRRNAVMSAVSLATVIVEASETSGTRSQAQAAIYQKRKLFILEDCFKQAKWPTTFLAKGAIRVKNAQDLLSELKDVHRP